MTHKELIEQLNEIDRHCIDEGLHFYDFKSLYEEATGMEPLSPEDRNAIGELGRKASQTGSQKDLDNLENAITAAKFKRLKDKNPAVEAAAKAIGEGVEEPQEYKVRFYVTKGPNKGDLDHEETFDSREDAISAYRASFDRKLFSLNPTVWKFNDQTGKWEMLHNSDLVEQSDGTLHESVVGNAKNWLIDKEGKTPKEAEEIINKSSPEEIEKIALKYTNNGKKSKSLKESVEEPYFRAYITNLGKYNEGALVGKWVDFPIDEDDFEGVLKSIGIGDSDEFGTPYEEWFVSDYECNLPGFNWQDLGEYPSYETLQAYGEDVASIDDIEAVSNAMEVTGDLQSAIDGLSDGSIIYYRGIDDYSDLAYMLIDEMGGIEVLGRDTIERYFDYEMLGRDLGFDEYEDSDGNMVSAGEYFCGDENATDEEIGEAFVDDVGFDGVGNIEGYFDYEAFGRDLRYDGYYLTSDGCILEESYNTKISKLTLNEGWTQFRFKSGANPYIAKTEKEANRIIRKYGKKNIKKIKDGFFEVDDVKKESLKENKYDPVIADLESIEKFLRDEGFTNYDVYWYDNYPMGTSKIDFEISGDWKHDHWAFKELIQEWAQKNGRKIWKIDTVEQPSDSDYYEAVHSVYITKDGDSFDKLTSMRGLFGENLTEDEGVALKEKLVDAPQEVIDKLIEILAKYGFILDDSIKHENPSKSLLFGDTHIQVINPDSFIDGTDEISVQEQLREYISREMIDEIHSLYQESNCPITWNFGINKDGHVTGGLDVMKCYVEESLNEDYGDKWAVYDSHSEDLVDVYDTKELAKEQVRYLHKLQDDGMFLPWRGPFFAEPYYESLNEDTEKNSKGKWVNKGKEGTHGTFKTKKAADAQRKAMFANGYRESLIQDLHEGFDSARVKLNDFIDELIEEERSHTVPKYRDTINSIEDAIDYRFSNDINYVKKLIEEGNVQKLSLAINDFKRRSDSYSHSSYGSDIDGWEKSNDSDYGWEKYFYNTLSNICSEAVKKTNGVNEDLKRIDNDGKKFYINELRNAEDKEDLEDIVHEIFFYDKGLFAMLRHFPKKMQFEELRDKLIEIVESTVLDEGLGGKPVLNENLMDAVLDRADGVQYDPRKFYNYIRAFGYEWYDDILREMDSGEEEDVADAIIDAIRGLISSDGGDPDNQYAQQLYQFIRGSTWITNDKTAERPQYLKDIEAEQNSDYDYSNDLDGILPDDELEEDYQSNDDSWGDPYTFDEVERELKKITNGWRDKEGTIRCYYEQEKEFGKQILKKHYKYVDVSDGRTGPGQDMSWVLAYSSPKGIKESMDSAGGRKNINLPAYAVSYVTGYGGGGVNRTDVKYFRTKDEQKEFQKQLESKNVVGIRTYKVDNFYHTLPEE